MLGLGLLGCVIVPSCLSDLFSDFTLPGVTEESYSKLPNKVNSYSELTMPTPLIGSLFS
jgi:hypothetical protein